MSNYKEVAEHEVIEQVLEHMKQLGIEPIYNNNLIADGNLHRYSLEGDRSRERSGAYVIHTDGRPSWYIQSWRHDIKATGSYKGEMPEFTPEEKKAFAKKKAEERRVREAHLKEVERRCTSFALRQYKSAIPANSTSTYLQIKSVQPEQGIKELNGKLLVPLIDINGNFKSLQYIFPNRDKIFAKGTSPSGAFFPIGKITPNKPIFVCEGFATGSTIHQLTITTKNREGSPVICAMNCGNLKSVVKALRAKYPDNKIFICADNDTKNEDRIREDTINATNPGLFHASAIIRDNLANGLLFPVFNSSDEGSDWNDYCAVYGFENAQKEFKKQLELARINRISLPSNSPKTQTATQTTENTEKKTKTATKKEDNSNTKKEEKKISLDDIELISAADLISTDFAPIRWAVPNIIPEGLTIFAGNPKVGKSWCALDLAITIGIGGYAFGNIEVEKGRTLYLAYEDTQPRIKSRMLEMGITKEDLDEAGITISTTFPKQEEKGLEYLELFIQKNPDTRLIIIDTLEKFRKPTPNKNIYKEEYQTLSEIKALADKHHIAIVCIHHFNKGMASDWINKVSGTNAIAGAADTIIALQRDRVSDGLTEGMNAVLHITSRMCEERDLALKFENFRWNITGKVEKKRSNEEQLIIDFLKEKGEIGATPKEIADEIGGNYNSLKTRLRKLSVEGFILRLSYGKYILAEYEKDTKEKEEEVQINYKAEFETF